MPHLLYLSFLYTLIILRTGLGSTERKATSPGRQSLTTGKSRDCPAPSLYSYGATIEVLFVCYEMRRLLLLVFFCVGGSFRNIHVTATEGSRQHSGHCRLKMWHIFFGD